MALAHEHRRTSFSKVSVSRAPALGARELRAIRAPTLLLIGDA
jgi:hypothetical protein